MYRTILLSQNTTKEFPSGTTATSFTNNGKEYELLLRTIAEIGAAYIHPGSPTPCVFGSVDKDYLKHRFLFQGKMLIGEKPPEGFPDCAIVTDQVIMIFDHFKIDASGAIISNRTGENRGTLYQRFLGKWLSNEKDVDLNALEKGLVEKGIRFSPNNLISSLRSSFTRKAKKIQRYREAICQHISKTAPAHLAAIDLAKPREIWLLIEDISPTTNFKLIAGELADLLQNYPAVAGIVYVHNPLATVLPLTAKSVALVKNDSDAREGLRALHHKKR